MAEYITEQKRILKKILEDNCDSAYTVEELLEKMKVACPDKAPGKSTVYRLITHLVNEGTVKRFSRDDGRKSAYQIVGGEHCDCHLHLKCTNCGKLIHLDDKVSDELLLKVQSTNDFSVSEEATVLFGKCGECKKNNRSNNK